VDGRRCGVVRSQSAGSEPLSTGLKQPAEDAEAAIGRQRTKDGKLVHKMFSRFLKNLETSEVQFSGVFFLDFYARQYVMLSAYKLPVSPCLSRPGTELSPGEIETPGFYRVIA